MWFMPQSSSTRAGRTCRYLSFNSHHAKLILGPRVHPACEKAQRKLSQIRAAACQNDGQEQLVPKGESKWVMKRVLKNMVQREMHKQQQEL